MAVVADSVWTGAWELARREPGYTLSALLGTVILLLLIRQWWVRAWRRLVILGRQRRAYSLERGAHGFLEAQGYSIEAVQARTHYRLLVDGEAEDIELRVDFIVRKQGRNRRGMDVCLPTERAATMWG